ncbi:hypothetical protein [Furfurilactobacillus milii]|uniref:hypothetical protein n=1 Tax=Furfurilactobacillus milii TaxID=2888272 RepID=UPI001F33649E|nr:hypothetical protein [Furfurilactobacillus milii]MCF6418504.1 hypothetical protein [Furfurilactobacillus milii]
MFKKTQLFGVIAAFGLLIGPAMSVRAAGDVGSATTQVTAGFIAGEGQLSQLILATQVVARLKTHLTQGLVPRVHCD